MSKDSWKLTDAKGRLSELVRRARDEGPQTVTVRGSPSVVILDAEEYERLTAAEPKLAFVPFLESLHAGGLDLIRQADAGRDLKF